MICTTHALKFSRKYRNGMGFLRLLFVCFIHTIFTGANGVEISGSMRLIRDGNLDSTNAFWPSGIVQVYISEDVGWGNVCDNGGFGREEVDVICHQLGFIGAATNLTIPFSNTGMTTEFGMDDSDTVIQNVNCSTSTHLTLFQCSLEARPSMIDADCDNSRDVIVYCDSTRIATEINGNIRLVKSSVANVGVLQVYCNDADWGTVCGDDGQFSDTEATLACAQLGYNSFSEYFTVGAPNSGYSAFPSSIPIWLHMFPDDCQLPTDPSSSDQCLTQCSQCPTSAVSACNHDMDIVLMCAHDSARSAVGTNNETASTCSLRNQGGGLGPGGGLNTMPFTSSTPTGSPGPVKGGQSLVLPIAIAIVTVLVAIIIVIIVAIVIVYLVHRRKSRQQWKQDSDRRSDVPHSKENEYIRPPVYELQVVSKAEAASVSDILLPCLIDKANLKLIEKVGQGEFGVVYRGLLTVYEKNEPEVQSVAVKTLKGKYSQTQTDELIVEAEKMIHFNHLNVLSLTGVCVGLVESPCLVMPYMSNGSLLSYLRKESADLVVSESADENLLKDTVKHLLSMCLQVANGMAYLTEQKFVHRDLAARNCMISADAIIKVADFGLAEDVYTAEYFKQERSSDDSVKLPLKWMALESIHYGIFSEKTDVWSYGILCWEVFSAGKSPYPGMSPREVVEMLDSGERLSKPLNPVCTDEIYKFMLSCWDKSYEKRPHFSDIVIRAEKILAPLADYIDFTDMFARKLSENDLKVI